MSASRIIKFAVLLAAIGIVNLSIRPVYRLSEQMPAKFGQAQGTHEQEEARLYWQCTVRSVQWKYGYGYVLPEAPPPEFTIGTADVHSGTPAAAARMRYWRQVRELWPVPGIWKMDYQFSLDWMAEDVKSAARWIQYEVAQITYVTPSR